MRFARHSKVHRPRGLPWDTGQPWMPAQPSSALALRVPAPAPSPPNRGRHRFLEIAAVRGIVAVLLAFVYADARAQWSGSVSLVSDYRYRGISLTGNDPALQGTVNYDDPTGFYAGSFFSNVRFAFTSGRDLQALSFAGYVWQLPSGVTGDVGVDYSFFT